jgi:hypothetical protein
MRQNRDKGRPKKAAADSLGSIPCDRAEFEAYMAMCEAAWRAGETLAVAEATRWSRQHQQPVPAWVDDAVFRLALRCRRPSTNKRLEDAQRQLIRYVAVRDLRQVGLKARPKKSWLWAYEEASDKLKGTFARGSDETMKAAYNKVAGDLKAGRQGKYFTDAQARTVGGVGPLAWLPGNEPEGEGK